MHLWSKFICLWCKIQYFYGGKFSIAKTKPCNILQNFHQQRIGMMTGHNQLHPQKVIKFSVLFPWSSCTHYLSFIPLFHWVIKQRLGVNYLGKSSCVWKIAAMKSRQFRKLESNLDVVNQLKLVGDCEKIWNNEEKLGNQSPEIIDYEV